MKSSTVSPGKPTMMSVESEMGRRAALSGGGVLGVSRGLGAGAMGA